MQEPGLHQRALTRDAVDGILKWGIVTGRREIDRRRSVAGVTSATAAGNVRASLILVCVLRRREPCFWIPAWPPFGFMSSFLIAGSRQQMGAA